MAATPLGKDSQFTVGEEKNMNYVLAFLFFALAAYGIIDAVLRKFTGIDYQSLILPLAIIPGIWCIKKANSKKVYIRINKDGIYKDEKKVTGWSGFLKAYITQDPKKWATSISDKFQLVVEYRAAGNPKQGIRKRIPLTNTQNKSEEDIMAAISFFLNLYKNSHPDTVTV